MKWRILIPGKPSFPWTREGTEMYLTRLQRMVRVEVVYLKSGDLRAYEQASGDAWCVALDERGEAVSTLDLGRRVDRWEMERVKRVAVWVGGAEGLPAGARERVGEVYCLGRVTLMHELAQLVWMEQLYRVYALKSGSPYHRGG